MAIIKRSDPTGRFRGKVGGLVYSLQPDGSTTVRELGGEGGPSTVGEKKGQKRMKLGHPYVHWALTDPVLKAQYADEARQRNMRPYDLAMSDFLTDPVILTVDAAKYSGRIGGYVLIVTEDPFKVVAVALVVRSAAGERLEEGLATPAAATSGSVWVYIAQRELLLSQEVTLQVTATDRCGHSSIRTTVRDI